MVEFPFKVNFSAVTPNNNIIQPLASSLRVKVGEGRNENSIDERTRPFA